MRVALVLPPLTQLNTPYPSIAYLARHLRDEGHQTTQRDAIRRPPVAPPPA